MRWTLIRGATLDDAVATIQEVFAAEHVHIFPIHFLNTFWCIAIAFRREI